MSLSSDDKQRCRKNLGYSGRYHQVQTVLEQALLAVDSAADSALEADIVECLDECDNARTKIKDALNRQKYSRIEDIYYMNEREIAEYRDYGRGWTAQLSALLHVPASVDVWGGAPMMDGGNEIRFG